MTWEGDEYAIEPPPPAPRGIGWKTCLFVLGAVFVTGACLYVTWGPK